jgi:hypothetical protein
MAVQFTTPVQLDCIQPSWEAVTKTRTGLGLDWTWTGGGLEVFDVV